MKRFFLICLFFVISLLPQTIFPQKSQPTPTPPEKDSDVIKVSTNLIQVDFVVTDKKNRPVKDLKSEDFEVYEDGKKVDISSFSFVSSKSKNRSNGNTGDNLGLSTNENGLSLNDKISVPTTGKSNDPARIRRTLVLVVDDLGLSFRSIKQVRNAIKKFIKEQVRDGDLVTIVTTGGASVLPAFTSDKKQLIVIVNKLKWGPKSRGGVDYYDPISPTLLEERSSENLNLLDQAQAEKALLEDIELARKNESSVGTLGALSYFVNGMQNLPGRKALIFFSEGFSLSNETRRNSSTASTNDSGKAAPSGRNRFSSGVADALRTLVKIANQSSVVIYAIDPRGLQNVGMAFADEDIRKAFQDDFKPGQTDDKRINRDYYFRQSQDGLRVLAKETGGFAILNQNDLSKGLEKVADDQSYYLLSYIAEREVVDSSGDAAERVVIKAKDPNLKVRYRKAFYSPNSANSEIADSKNPREKVGLALAYPFKANEIQLTLYSITGNYAQGDFIRFLINISAEDLKFKRMSNGMRKANYDLLAITLNADGKPINQFAKNFNFTVNEATYQNILKNGFVYDLPVLLKKSGIYHFRVAVFDSESGKVGAAAKFLETPKFEKKRLWVSNLVLKTQGRDGNDGMFTDTTRRQFTLPVSLNYGAVVYNAESTKNESPNLEIRKRLIRDEKVVFETPFEPFSTAGQQDLKRMELSGRIQLRENLEPGNYIFQIIIVDKSAKKKSQVATQWIDFEVSKK